MPSCVLMVKSEELMASDIRRDSHFGTYLEGSSCSCIVCSQSPFWNEWRSFSFSWQHACMWPEVLDLSNMISLLVTDQVIWRVHGVTQKVMCHKQWPAWPPAVQMLRVSHCMQGDNSLPEYSPGRSLASIPATDRRKSFLYHSDSIIIAFCIAKRRKLGRRFL